MSKDISAAPATPLDLASLDTAALCDQGAEMELVHPATGEPLGVYLTLAGVDSRAWRKAVAAQVERRLSRRGGKISAEEIQANDIEILARCTLAWRNVVLDGEALSCTPDTARALYKRLPWAREQADAFAANRASYLGE